MKIFEDYIHQSKYARYLDEQNRRESWEETCDRYVDYMLKQAEEKTDISPEHLSELKRILG